MTRGGSHTERTPIATHATATTGQSRSLAGDVLSATWYVNKSPQATSRSSTSSDVLERGVGFVRCVGVVVGVVVGSRTTPRDPVASANKSTWDGGSGGGSGDGDGGLPEDEIELGAMDSVGDRRATMCMRAGTW